MSASWDQQKFDRWQELRKALKEKKRSKDYAQIIEIAGEIIDLDKEAKFIKIMTPLFYKEIGVAYEKLGELDDAIKNYKFAIEGFSRYREYSGLNTPDDWLKDIRSIDKKIEKLQARL